jgi:predicted membrane protein
MSVMDIWDALLILWVVCFGVYLGYIIIEKRSDA